MFKEKYLILEWNSFCIKSVLVQVSFGKSEVLSSKYFKISEEYETYEQAISFFLNQFFPEIENIILILSSKHLIVRDFLLPIKNRKSILDVLPFEFENHISYDIDSIEVVANILEIDKENSFINAFGIEHQVLQEYMAPLLNRNLFIKSLLIDSVCLSSIVNSFYNKYFQEKNIVQIDVGEYATLFNIIKEGKLIHTRYIDVGFVKFLEQISNLINISVSETSELLFDTKFSIFDISNIELFLDNFKKLYSVTNAQISEISLICRKLVREIIIEVNRSLISLEKNPDEIYLSGILSKMRGAREYLTLLMDKDIYSYNFLDFSDNRMLICMGALYHSELSKLNQIDYSKTKFVKRYNSGLFSMKQIVQNFMTHFIVLGLSFLIFISTFFTKIYLDREEAIRGQFLLKKYFQENFEREPSQDKPIVTQAQEILEKEKKETRFTSLKQQGLLDILMELTKKFPSELDQSFVLDRFSFDENYIQIQARVTEFSEVGEIEKILKNSNLFQEVEVSNKKLLRGVGKNKVSLKIKFEVKKNKN